jgi:hypothetical protein
LARRRCTRFSGERTQVSGRNRLARNPIRVCRGIDPAEQLLLVAWVRAGAKAREPLAILRRAELERFGFTAIAGPSRDKYWSAGTAHLLPLAAAELDHAMRMLTKVYAALTSAEQDIDR